MPACHWRKLCGITVKRELEGKPANWVLHTLVIKSFILSPEPIEWHYVRTELRREEALKVEKRRIARLLLTGQVLANVQHNRHSLPVTCTAGSIR
jgi:hypothetical protein